MRKRCTHCDDISYDNYGGRGIKCRYKDFPAFLDDVGLAPTPQHQIDRIDNNGHYEKGNCRWVTRTEQQRNTRRNRQVTYRGQTKTMAEWAEVTGIPYKTLYWRIVIDAMQLEQAFRQPVHSRTHVEYQGAQITLAELSVRTGVNINTLRSRYHNKGLRGDALTRPPQKGGARD